MELEADKAAGIDGIHIVSILNALSEELSLPVSCTT